MSSPAPTAISIRIRTPSRPLQGWRVPGIPTAGCCTHLETCHEKGYTRSEKKDALPGWQPKSCKLDGESYWSRDSKEKLLGSGPVKPSLHSIRVLPNANSKPKSKAANNASPTSPDRNTARDAVKRLWSHLNDGSAPRLVGIEPPKAFPDKSRYLHRKIPCAPCAPLVHTTKRVHSQSVTTAAPAKSRPLHPRGH